MYYKYLMCLILLSCFGCAKTHSIEYYDFIQSHEKLINETNVQLVKSIHAEIESYPQMNSNDKKSLLELIERLELINKQAKLIVKYENETTVNEQTISDLIRNRWESTVKEQ